MEGGTSDGVVGAPATSMESRDDDDANREGGCEKAEAFGGVGAADGDGRVSSAETFDEIASSDIEGEESDISAAAAAGSKNGAAAAGKCAEQQRTRPKCEQRPSGSPKRADAGAAEAHWV